MHAQYVEQLSRSYICVTELHVYIATARILLHAHHTRDYGGSGICAVRPARKRLLLISPQLPPLVLVVAQQLQKLKSLLHLLLRRRNTGIAALIHCGAMNFPGLATSKTAHACAFVFWGATLFKLSSSENAVTVFFSCVRMCACVFSSSHEALS